MKEKRGAKEFLNIAHRGASGYCPENTMVAFEKAMDMGIKWMECDVRLTLDEQVVVIHDETLDRTTDGTGLVSMTRLADVQKLDAGSWFGSEYAGVRVPTLSELLDSLREDTHLVIEIKDGIIFPEIVDKTFSLVTSRGLENRVNISAFHWDILARVKQLNPRMQTSALVDFDLERRQQPRIVDGKEIAIYSSPEELASTAISYGVEVVCPPARAISSEFVSFLHERGLLVRAWGLKGDDLEEMSRLVRCGVDGMTINFPDKLRDIWVAYQEDKE